MSITRVQLQAVVRAASTEARGLALTDPLAARAFWNLAEAANTLDALMARAAATKPVAALAVVPQVLAAEPELVDDEDEVDEEEFEDEDGEGDGAEAG